MRPVEPAKSAKGVPWPHVSSSGGAGMEGEPEAAAVGWGLLLPTPRSSRSDEAPSSSSSSSPSSSSTPPPSFNIDDNVAADATPPPRIPLDDDEEAAFLLRTLPPPPPPPPPALVRVVTAEIGGGTIPSYRLTLHEQAFGTVGAAAVA